MFLPYLINISTKPVFYMDFISEQNSGNFILLRQLTASKTKITKYREIYITN